MAGDLSDFVLDELSEQNQYTDEKDFNIFTNFKLPLQVFNSENGFLKFGFRARFKDKQRNNNFYEFKDAFEDTYSNMSIVNTRDYSQNDFLAGSQYQAGTFATPEWLGSVTIKYSRRRNCA